MSVQTEITRITNSRDKMRTKLIELGLANSNSKIDDIANAVDGIVNVGAVSVDVQEGTTYTIPAGYHNGAGTVKGVAGGGNYSLQSKTITPTKSQQSVSPDQGYYGLDSVTVEAIPEAYQNVSSVTATAADVLTTKVFVAKDGTSTAGTMPNIGSVSEKLSTTTTSYTVPKGYHSGSGTVSITLENKGTITPTTTDQTITPSTSKVISSVTVAGDSNLVSENIAKGVSIFGVDGSFTDSESVSTGQTAASSTDILSGKSAWVDGVEVKGNIPSKTAANITVNGRDVSISSLNAGYYVPSTATNAIPAGELNSLTVSSSGLITGSVKTAGYLGTSSSVTKQLPTRAGATITPTKSAQTAISTGYFATGAVTVAAIPAKFVDSTTVTAEAANVLADTVAVVKTGASTWATASGTMVNNGTITGTLTGLGTVAGDTVYTIPAGYTSGGTITLTSDIATALAAI